MSHSEPEIKHWRGVLGRFHLVPSWWLNMDFAQRLAAFRSNERSLTQQSLADHVVVHLTQINRCEAGDSQPMLKMIRRLVIALRSKTAAKRMTARD